MKNSLKIVHNGNKCGIKVVKKIYYKDINLRHIFIRELEFKDQDFLNIEYFDSSNTIIKEDYFTSIDLYSIYKENKVIFSTEELPLTSDNECTSEEYKLELIKYLRNYIPKKILSVSDKAGNKNLRDYILSEFYFKFNLLDTSKMFLEKIIKSKKFLFIKENIAKYEEMYFLIKEVYLSDNESKEIDNPKSIAQIVNIINMYGSDNNSIVYFLKEIILCLKIEDLIFLLRFIKTELFPYHVRIYFFYMVGQAFRKKNFNKLASWYFMKCYLSIHDGINLEFKFYLRNLLYSIITEKGWNLIFLKIDSKVLKKEEKDIGLIVDVKETIDIIKEPILEDNQLNLIYDIKYSGDYEIYDTSSNTFIYTSNISLNQENVLFIDRIKINLLLREEQKLEIIKLEGSKFENFDKVCIPIFKKIDSKVVNLTIYCQESVRISTLTVMIKNIIYKINIKDVNFIKVKPKWNPKLLDACEYIKIFKGELGKMQFKFIALNCGNEQRILVNGRSDDYKRVINKDILEITKFFDKEMLTRLVFDFELAKSLYRRIVFECKVEMEELFIVKSKEKIVNNISSYILYEIYPKFKFILKFENEKYEFEKSMQKNIIIAVDSEFVKVTWYFKERTGVLLI